MEGLPNQSLNDQEFEDGPKQETILDSIAQKSEQTKAAALEVIQTIESSSLQVEQKSTLTKRVAGAAKKVLRVSSFGAALTGAVGMADYALTRHHVSQELGPDNIINYLHDDPETTHIINLMSGKETMSDSDKREALMDYLSEALKDYHSTGEFEGIQQADLEKMSLDELAETAKQLRGGKALKVEDPNPGKFDSQLYNALWKLEQENGSPKVRFRLGSNKKFMGVYDPGVIFFDPTVNTVFINLGENEASIDDYLSEITHARQFDQNPASSTFRAIKGIVQARSDSLLPQKHSSIERSYDNQYTQPGTLEHEAHHVIEPQLKSELESLTPTRTANLQAEKEKERELKLQLQNEDRQLEAAEHSARAEAFYAYTDKAWKLKDENEKKNAEKEYRAKIDQIKKEFIKKRIDLYKKYGR